MSQEPWESVDSYFIEKLVPENEALKAALDDSEAAGLPSHAVAPNQGMFLNLIARLLGAKKILEIGTLGGYSTIWLARALAAGGKLVTLEASALHAAVARKNIERAGVADRVDIHVGKAAALLPSLFEQGAGPFDLIFIDAGKPSNPIYLDWAVKLSRPGTVIVGDNVVRNGAVVDGNSKDPNVLGVRSFIDLVAENPRLSTTALQTVGLKGYDGFLLALVEG